MRTIDMKTKPALLARLATLTFRIMAQLHIGGVGGQNLLIIKDSRSHSDIPQSVGLLWTSDQLVAETSTFTKHKTHDRQTSMHPAGFEQTIPTSDRPQTLTLDRAATGIG